MDSNKTGIFTTLSSQLAQTDFRQALVSEKEKIEMWFIEPLKRMKGDDGFACLMLCFPLLEAIMRHELKIPDDQDLALSDNSPALHWFAKFMTIPDSEARDVWDAFRNGLLHRAMIKAAVPYSLTGESKNRPAESQPDQLSIYVWDLRDAVVAKLKQHHSKLWRSVSSCPLPRIQIKA
jgi:hypothetical protein